mgnify:CR=1 FL=1
MPKVLLLTAFNKKKSLLNHFGTVTWLRVFNSNKPSSTCLPISLCQSRIDGKLSELSRKRKSLKESNLGGFEDRTWDLVARRKKSNQLMHAASTFRKDNIYFKRPLSSKKYFLEQNSFKSKFEDRTRDVVSRRKKSYQLMYATSTFRNYNTYFKRPLSSIKYFLEQNSFKPK